MDLLTRLVGLERQFWTCGGAFYREHLAPEFVMLFPGIGTLGREATIRSIEKGQRWSTVEVLAPQLVRLAPTAVVLAYAAEATREGDTAPYTALVSSVYVEDGGAWRLAAHHHSPTRRTEV